MSTAAGYSARPLPAKLGLKDGQRVLFIDLPDELSGLTKACDFAEVRSTGWSGIVGGGSGYDVAHGFTRSAGELKTGLDALRATIRVDGMIWVSWPKKAAKVPTDVTEDVVRGLALEGDLVDVKVCAVDDVWSGLKLVVRKELRH